jgi:macrodomain Ter protein organizer (MatP/YcbG family)
MARIKRYFEEEYSKLSETDKKWIDSEFAKWLDIYLADDCQSGCPSCGCSCPSE